MRLPEMPQGQTNSVENSEVAAFANYVRLTLSKLNPRKFRRAKKCIGDILFQIEESDEMEVAIGAATRFSTHGRHSPAQSQVLVLIVQVKQIKFISRTSLLLMKACSKCIPLHPWSITN